MKKKFTKKEQTSVIKRHRVRGGRKDQDNTTVKWWHLIRDLGRVWVRQFQNDKNQPEPSNGIFVKDFKYSGAL